MPNLDSVGSKIGNLGVVGDDECASDCRQSSSYFTDLQNDQILDDDLFWQRAFHSSMRRRGFREELIAFSKNLSLDQPNQTIIVNEAKRLRRSFLINSTNRCAIEYAPEQMIEVERVMRLYNDSGRISQDYPLYIVGARGVHYYPNRWSLHASRKHRHLDERLQPLFSASILHTQSCDTASARGEALLPPSQQSQRAQLCEKAIIMANFMMKLRDSQPVIGQSTRYHSPYIFNSLAHALQDAYSNDLTFFDQQLTWFRRYFSSTWGVVFKNSHNPNVSIGLRIAHALKYAFGAKPYHGQAISPGYDQNGRPLCRPVGKIYLMLLPVSATTTVSGPNHVSQMDYQGQIAVDDHISPEKELTYAGYLPADCLVDHSVIQWPSFSGDWCPSDRMQYGLDEAMYQAFCRLFMNTRPNSPARNQVQALLFDWLCVFHELCLVRIARHHAIERGGFVFYLTRTGHLSLVPDIGRVFTGGDKYVQLRNQVHSARRLRLLIAQRILARLRTPMPIVPCSWPLIRYELDQLYSERLLLKSLRHKIVLSRSDEGLIFAERVSQEAIFERLMQTVFSLMPKHMPSLRLVFVPRQPVDHSVYRLLFKRLFVVGTQPYRADPRARYFHLIIHQDFMRWMFQVFWIWHQQCQLLMLCYCDPKERQFPLNLVTYLDVFLSALLFAIRKEMVSSISPQLVACSLFRPRQYDMNLRRLSLFGPDRYLKFDPLDMVLYP